MIGSDIFSIVLYLLPGYIISSFKHYIVVRIREKETSRVIESLILSLLFYTILNRTETMEIIFDSIQQGHVLSRDILQRLPTLTLFLFIGTATYTGLFILWTIFAEDIFNCSKHQFVFDAFINGVFKKKKKFKKMGYLESNSLKAYFKLDGDNDLYRGVLHQADLDEGTEIWLFDVEIKSVAYEKKHTKFQYFANDMIINRDKLIYLYTKDGDV